MLQGRLFATAVGILHFVGLEFLDSCFTLNRFDSSAKWIERIFTDQKVVKEHTGRVPRHENIPPRWER